MFAFIKKLFQRKEQIDTKKFVAKVNESCNGIDKDFQQKIDQMLKEVLSEQKKRLNKDLQEILPGIKI